MGDSGTTNPISDALSAADHAIAVLLDRLADPGPGGLAGLTTDAVLEVSIGIERLRNRFWATDRPLVAELDRRGAAEKQLRRSTAHLMADTLRLTRTAAVRRVATATSLTPQPLLTGGTQPASRPVLAAAQDDGTVSPEQIRVILDGCSAIDRLVGLHPHPGDDPVTPDDVRRAEEDLCRQARLFDARELGACANRIVDCLDPDGDPDRTEAQRRQRRLTLREHRDGMWRIAGDLLPETGLALKSVLDPLSRPRRDDPGTDPIGSADLRSPEQRRHDALDDVVGRVARAGGLPVAGGVPATVIVTIDEDSLRSRTGHAWTSGGSRLPIPTLLRLADQAQIIPTVLNADGSVLWQGRSKRIATLPQTLALYSRDGGCTFPGCDHPPEWCERHHVIPWEAGGRTDLDNLTLLCRYHHHRFEKHGWTCSMIGGLPHWTAPPRLDPDQSPQLHHRLRHRRRHRRMDERDDDRDRPPESSDASTEFVVVPVRWSDFDSPFRPSAARTP